MTRPRRPMRRIGDLIPGLANELGLEPELKLATAMASWERVVAEQVPPAAGTSRLLEVAPPALVVSAPDPLTAQELRLRSGILLDAFAAAPGGTRLRELRIVIRSLPRPGRPSGGTGRPV